MSMSLIQKQRQADGKKIKSQFICVYCVSFCSCRLFGTSKTCCNHRSYIYSYSHTYIYTYTREATATETVTPIPLPIPVFPGAEGFGSMTIGGRGGEIIEVTNLNDSGPGSLRAAISTEGKRTVVFRVAGTIELESSLMITDPYITIAGQTAPGEGITLRGISPAVEVLDANRDP